MVKYNHKREADHGVVPARPGISRNHVFLHALEVGMKRKLKTILLLLCAFVLMLCGALLYQSRTEKPPETPAPMSDDPAPRESGGETPLTPVPVSEQEENAEEPVQEDAAADRAPDFTLQDRYGEEEKLSAFFGKPIIINFWATWCGPCRMELPFFNEANEEYGDRIQFLMVDLVDGAYETREGAIAFAENNGYGFPLYFDGLGEGSLAYSIQAIPLTVVIDADGRLVETHLGSMSSEELQVLIDKVLHE